MREKSSEEESDSSEESESHSENEPEYSFAGFNVEFSEKIVLTPVAADASAQGKGRVGP